MAPSIGLNLRVTGYCNQGGRRYMEDVFSVAYQQTEDEKDLEYAYFGIFDGHGGREAALYAKEHLMDSIVKQKGFWSDDDDSICKAIHQGFVHTHLEMWKELPNWPTTASGLPSTAGTTASIAFIRRGKIYVGHVGDSAIILGSQVSEDSKETWRAECLTVDHKPESSKEFERIQKIGGKVVNKSGVPRVVWNRPKPDHQGPVRRSTHIDEIPFLAVARSLGDLWSYNPDEDDYVVSPEPDTYCYTIDITKQRCLILGTDGCWNMMKPEEAVREVCSVEKSNEQHMLHPSSNRQWINPSKRLVDKAIERWNGNNLRADNTSIVTGNSETKSTKKYPLERIDNCSILTVMLDPPGPPRAQVLKKQREVIASTSNTKSSDPDSMAITDRGSMAIVTNREEPEPHSTTSTADNNHPGLSIISRFPNAASLKDVNLADKLSNAASVASANKIFNEYRDQTRNLCRLSTVAKLNKKDIYSTSSSSAKVPSENKSETTLASTVLLEDRGSDVSYASGSHEDIQVNEVSSSDDDEDNSGGRRDQSSSANKGPPETPKLSRELSALQLTSGTTPTTASSSIQVISSPRRGRSSHQQQQSLSRTRTSSEGCSNSDTENEAPNPELMPPKSLHHHDPISAKGNGSPKKVNPRYVKSKEAKVQKSATMTSSNLQPSTTTPTTVMSLRPRGSMPDFTSSTTTPSRKRKPESFLGTLNQGQPSKSPKMMPAVFDSKPVMTRSRTAKVVPLKMK